MCGCIHLHVRMEELFVRIWFSVVKNCAVKVLLGATFVDKFFKGIFQQDGPILPIPPVIFPLSVPSVFHNLQFWEQKHLNISWKYGCEDWTIKACVKTSIWFYHLCCRHNSSYDWDNDTSFDALTYPKFWRGRSFKNKNYSKYKRWLKKIKQRQLNNSLETRNLRYHNRTIRYRMKQNNDYLYYLTRTKKTP